IVARQDGIERLAEANDAAAAVEGVEGEGHDDIVTALRAIESVLREFEFRRHCIGPCSARSPVDPGAGVRCVVQETRTRRPRGRNPDPVPPRTRWTALDIQLVATQRPAQDGLLGMEAVFG